MDYVITADEDLLALKKLNTALTVLHVTVHAEAEMKKSNETTEVLLHLVAQSYNRHAWHGPNLRSSLRGLTAEEAAWTPGPGRHSIWELTLHCAYWKYVVIRKLEGRGRGTFARSPSNFPHLPEPADTTAWKADLAFLDQTHRELLESVRKALARPAKEASARAKIHHLIEGVASHDVYHAGQIRLLIRLRAASLHEGSRGGHENRKK